MGNCSPIVEDKMRNISASLWDKLTDRLTYDLTPRHVSWRFEQIGDMGGAIFISVRRFMTKGWAK